MNYSTAVFGTFLMNGLGMLVMQYLAKYNAKYGVPCLALSCLTAFILTSLFGEKTEGNGKIPASLLTGIIAGLGWAGGLVWQQQAISLVPGYIIFPTVAGVCTLMVSVVSRVVFHEEIGKEGAWGIGLCVLAVVLLSI